MADKEQTPPYPLHPRSAESYYRTAVGQAQPAPAELPGGQDRYVAAGPTAEPTSAPVSPATPPKRARKSVDIREELARRERIKNDDAEQDILLKRKTLNLLFYLLFVETAAVFVLAFMQSVHEPWHFAMQDSSFKILVGATILQITAMLSVAVAYLFPRLKHDQ